MHSIIKHLHATLEQLQAEHQPIDIFLRDDDVDIDETTLRQLLHICLAREVPLNLEIIPGSLTDATIDLLRDQLRWHPASIELHQHGWRHTNHEPVGRKCEFGSSRSFAEQLGDITLGKARLDEAFGPRWFPAFTPPWNRCTKETFEALDQLGFQVLSKDRGKESVEGYAFREISTTLDLYRWRDGATLKTPEEILTALILQLHEHEPVGILLHHKVMDAGAFAFLAMLLGKMRQYSVVQWHTLGSLWHAHQLEGSIHGR